MADYGKFLEELIANVAEEGASDLHLSVGRHPVLRVSGQLVPLTKKPILAQADTAGLAEALMGKDWYHEFLTGKERDFSYSYKDKLRFRVNAYFQKGSVGVALRIVPYKIKTLEELNMPPALSEFTRRQQGFFLVVGPTGHGKSTTLAAMVDLINHTKTEHIITIEDPIEYIFTPDRSMIDQREVGLDTKDFATALRSMFRQDVNVAMIGEMRDNETMSAAVTAAETGHLIFSSLHTNNAAQTIDRIIDTFRADQQGQIRAQLASTLIGVFSQRLIPRVSGGLIPAYELLISNAAVRNLIRENKVHELDLVIETSAQFGMVSFNRSLIDLVRRGEITMENALLFSLNPQELRILAGK
ncbi:type IV pili twitching motility protein PilT [Candidatus Giovannonibacteria bacterium RIFCSPLOWO2_01_FULL_44_40]|uniref:Type IV pili twitching motility protein PilT n=1 Tax=Candidatus Giovannonibacteria bacterium RIFCSPHIGHO2_01_FULL_45_23 TaxID=1798325 RepID=A0A1F5VF29_9BACT|nr:MAG: type IV pili twitching motility protein PilT [Candidatus Giovannonibacteria bacterium RIFCSPHIGHO2_01_FULL_45_23]OGF76529.1 MAG: type IV pili twitching motility protein PilT [Candidatus Giovannonibacteria bacterium RIFCSPHIGHO2_02_FULL_45_13]OGF79795.1 MAG: type IV pili twitching motility protein PilT [Candidatus Giovannonibacteria bacterium RIFCSPLOWO2_01_FULL_44_40]